MISPFPYHRLPRWTHADVVRSRILARALAPERRPVSPVRALDPRWDALLAAPCTARPGPPRVDSLARVREHAARHCLAACLHHPVLGPAVALIERPLAASMVAALGGAEQHLPERGVLDAASEGSLQLLCAQAAWQLCAPAPPPSVRAVTDDVARALELLRDGPIWTWTWRLSCGLHNGDLVLVFALPAFTAHAEALALTDGACSSLDPRVLVPAELVLGCGVIAARELSTLERGDVFELDVSARAWIERASLPLALRMGAVTIEVERVERGVRSRSIAQVHRSNDMSTDGTETETSSDSGVTVRSGAMGEVPVDVDVVVARAHLPLGEISAWRLGEVIEFDVRLGEAVELRAGGRPIARGELCDVGGKLGVRVVQLL